jgi:hypothetical protein
MSEIQAVFCNECGRTSRHVVRAEYRQADDNDGVIFEQLHSVMECGGCGMVTFRTRQWFSEMQDYTQDPVYQYNFYPPRFERAMPVWFVELPDSIQDILLETYNAFYYEQNFLAAVGIRTALDMAIVEKVGDVGSFGDKIDLLLERGLINEDERNLLKTALDAGSAAAHRGYQPPHEDLNVMLDILESALSSLFVREVQRARLKASAEQLGERIPPRSRRGSKSQKEVEADGDGSNGV